jgi:hypothetical protein
MNRQPLLVAGFVFACSAVAELLSIDIMAGSFGSWVHHPRRMVLLATMVVVNLTNAVVAGYLVSRMRQAQLAWKQSEHQRQAASHYLNHHVRNALSALQYSAFLTKNDQAIEICNESISRIVAALIAADSGTSEGELRDFSAVKDQPKGQRSASTDGAKLL